MNRPEARESAELRRAWHSVQKALPGMLVATLAVGALTYVLSSRQTPSFEATTQLLASTSGLSNQQLGSSLVNLSAVPPEAYQGALNNPGVLARVASGVRSMQGVARNDRLAVLKDLQPGRAKELFVFDAPYGKPDYLSNGFYQLTARAPTPELAARLANEAAAALLEWDRRRGVDAVARVLRNLERQVSALNAQLASPRADAAQVAALREARAQRLSQLASMRLLSDDDAVQGTLNVVAPATAPADPVEPKPLRNAALAGLLALFTMLVLAVSRGALRHTILSAADLHGLPVLGSVPRVRGWTANARTAGLVEGAAQLNFDFLQTTLDHLTQRRAHKVLLVTSAHPGEGTSSVSLALAHAFARSGQATLLCHGSSAPGGQRKQVDPAALLSAEHRSTLPAVYDIGRHLDGLVLTPGDMSSSGNGLGVLARVATKYDTVIVDAPAVLSNIDAVRMADATTGVVLVVQAGRTTRQDVTRVLNTLQVCGATVLGAILNKTKRSQITVEPDALTVASRSPLVMYDEPSNVR